MKKFRLFILISIILVITKIGFSQYRVIISSDFPPFPVTNSDPDDLQSMVRFLLYWDVKNTRNEKEFKAFISKLRIFLIACQDASHEWLLSEFNMCAKTIRIIMLTGPADRRFSGGRKTSSLSLGNVPIGVNN